MSAVIGLNRMRLSQAVDELHDQGEEIWLSNLNSAAQSTVSGSDSALRLLEPVVAEMGAQRVKRLRVSVPAHSALMEPARTAVGEAMGDIAVDRPAFPLLANTSGRMIRTAPQVREDLVAAIDQPVQWGTGVAALAERGVTHWIQVSLATASLDYYVMSRMRLKRGAQTTSISMKRWHESSPPPKLWAHSLYLVVSCPQS